jgi:hypothetical protein
MKEYDLSGSNGAVVFRNLPEGLKVRLSNAYSDLRYLVKKRFASHCCPK